MSDRDRWATTRVAPAAAGPDLTGPDPHSPGPGGATAPVTALRALEGALGAACDDLFAVAPFPGDQATGHDVNRHVDELVDALRSVRAEVDDLARAMVVAQSRRARGR